MLFFFDTAPLDLIDRMIDLFQGGHLVDGKRVGVFDSVAAHASKRISHFYCPHNAMAADKPKMAGLCDNIEDWAARPAIVTPACPCADVPN